MALRRWTAVAVAGLAAGVAAVVAAVVAVAATASAGAEATRGSVCMAGDASDVVRFVLIPVDTCGHMGK